MDWNNIISFIAGGLIAIIPVIVANRYQAREKDKDRLEQKREAEIQNRQKWIERDILKIMDSTESLLKNFSDANIVALQSSAIKNAKGRDVSNKEESASDIKPHKEMLDNLAFEMMRTMDSIGRLVFSFEENEIRLAFSDFLTEATKFVNKNNDIVAKELVEEDEDFSLFALNKCAGEFQRVLRDKLISLRDN